MKFSLQKALQLLITFLILAVCVILVRYFGEDRIRELITSSGHLAPIVMVFIKTMTIIIAPLSGAPLYVFAGTLFGVGQGLTLLLIGDALGYSIAFFLSRFLGRKKIEQLILKNEGGMLGKIVHKISTIKGFLITCCMFCFASELVAYGAGLSKLPFRHFFPIFMAGDALIAFGIVWTSNKLGASIPMILGVFGALFVLSFVSWKLSRLTTKKRTT